MKTLSDKELQDWLDGQMNMDENLLYTASGKQDALYQKVVAELKSDAVNPGPTYGFADKVTRAAFVAAEAKKDRKQAIVISVLVALTLSFGAAVLLFYNVSLQQLIGNHSPAQVVLFAAFISVVIAAVQVADKKLVQKE